MRKVRKNEKGIALIVVLLALMFIFMLAASVATAGAITSKLAVSNARSHRNLYIAESQLSRTMWDVLWELRNHTSRRLGFMSELGEEDDPDEVRWFADGRPVVKAVGDKTISVVLDDANKGFDFSGNITGTKIQQIARMVNLPEEADQEPLQDFIDKLVDYTDKNDLHREMGAEREQYEDEQGFDLPRNSTLEFAEEALWIPGIEAAIFAERDYTYGSEGNVDDEAEVSTFNFNVSDYLRVIPYRGVNFPRTTRPSFFSSTDYQIRSLAELEGDELEEVREARKAWFAEGINIQESIPEIYPRLARVFSFNESGVYRIRIQVSDLNGLTVNTETIINISRNLPSYRENDFSGFRYWRKVNF